MAAPILGGPAVPSVDGAVTTHGGRAGRDGGVELLGDMAAPP